MDLSSKNQIAKLCIGQKHNKEHDGKASNVLSASAQSQAQLSHSFVEANIFEYFNPSQEDHASNSIVELGRPIA